jgi:hypothetical protein
VSESQSRRNRSATVLLFGENLHESRSIEHLLIAVNPGLERRVKAVPRPVSLTRGAGRESVRDWVGELRRTVRGFTGAGATVQAVLVHRDADGPDPDGVEEAKLAAQIVGVPAHPVVPVQMTEAWWFLFPEAVESVRPTAWRGKMPRHARNVETIINPKAELARVTGRGNKHPYTEADSIGIAQAVRDKGIVPVGTSASFERFRQLAKSIG